MRKPPTNSRKLVKLTRPCPIHSKFIYAPNSTDLTDLRKREAYDRGDDLIDPSEMFGGMGGMGGMHPGMSGGVQLDPEMLFNMMGGGRPGGGGPAFSFGGMPSGGGQRRGGDQFPGGFSF
jgi:DnaJ family protein C protein 7